jgi:PAS domain S-box-containing protein
MNSAVNFNSAETLRLLYELSAQLATAIDLQTTLEQVITLTVRFLNTERGSLVVLDENNQPIDAAMINNGKMQFNNAAQFAAIVKHGLIAWVIEHRQAAFVNDTSVDPRWLKRMDDQPDQTGAKSAMCIPLEARDQLVGILTIVHPTPNHFSLEQFEFLKAVADQAGIAVHNALLFDSLETMHRQYFELFQDSIAAILITNRDGMILQANRAAYQMMDKNDTDLAGSSIFDLHQAPFQLLGENFERLLTEDIVTYESLIGMGNSDDLPIKMFVRMLPRDLEGRIQWIIEDISESKQLETMRHDLLSMVYHDIRSPLSNVISSLELIKMMMPENLDPNVDDVFSVISRSANRIQRLVSNLLDIDRLEMKQEIMDAQAVDLVTLIETAISDVQPIMESRNQDFVLEMVDPVSELWVDEDMIRRVMINLLENASKYSPVGGKVSFRIEKDGEKSILFTVEDNGPGIPPEKLDMIFEKFTRVNYRKGPKGIGLGLAFCKMAVNAHGGRIWVKSDNESGAKFHFTLPSEAHESFQVAI